MTGSLVRMCFGTSAWAEPEQKIELWLLSCCHVNVSLSCLIHYPGKMLLASSDCMLGYRDVLVASPAAEFTP